VTNAEDDALLEPIQNTEKIEEKLVRAREKGLFYVNKKVPSSLLPLI
jgi:hypothetical protein